MCLFFVVEGDDRLKYEPSGGIKHLDLEGHLIFRDVFVVLPDFF